MTMNPLEQRVYAYLLTCRELSGYCTQNGWIDSDSLTFDIERQSASEVVVAVHFTEVVMEGSGCVADRVECFAKLRLTLSPAGEVEKAHPL